MSPLAPDHRAVARAALRRRRRRHRASASNSSRPRREKMEETLWESVKTLEPLQPRFVSVTYGAGGSTRERTHDTVVRIQQETPLNAAAHLTCVEASRSEIDEVALRLLAGRHPPHRRLARRSARARQGLPAPAPGRLCQCRRPGRRPEAGRAVRDLGRGLSRNAIRIRPTGPPISTISSARSTPAPTARSPSSSSRPNASSASATPPPRPGSTPSSCPGILPVSNVAQTRKFAEMCGAAIPRLDGQAVRGPGRPSRRPPARRRHRRRRALRPALCRRGPPVPFLHAQPRRARLRHLPPARPAPEG